jgi:predicted ATP-dependent endonuclease of OLD family
MTIKKLVIKNFKCIKELSIDLAPLTIFVGPNGSGKSSILEALALMSQCSKKNVSLRSEDAVRGELVEYDRLKSILHKGLDEAELSLGITVDVQAEEVRGDVERDLKDFSDLISRIPGVKELLLAYLDFLQKLGLNERKAIKISYTYCESNVHYSHSFFINEYSITSKYDKIKEEFTNEPKQLKIKSDNIFLSPFSVFGYPSHFFHKIVDAIKKRLSKVYYLSAERGHIPWTYEAKEKHGWVGKRGEYTLEILAELMKPEHDEMRLPYEILCEKFGIKNVWAGWESHNYLTSNYIDPLLNSTHKLPSLGHGSRQLLTVIAQLAYSEPGSIILIEEPEISLHPEYQRLLPILFGRAVNEGKQILVTTHSSYFPLSLDIVLEGYKLEGQTTRGWRSYNVKLSTSDVIVYEVTRDERDECTKVKKLELDEVGLKEGIPSFIKVEKEILGKFINRE